MEQLTRRDVAELLGVKVNTVDVLRRRAKEYRERARQTGHTADYTFPEPDGYLGTSPWWKPATIVRYAKNRAPGGYHGQMRNR